MFWTQLQRKYKSKEALKMNGWKPLDNIETE